MERIADNQDFMPSNGEVSLYNPDDTIRLKMQETKEGGRGWRKFRDFPKNRQTLITF